MSKQDKTSWIFLIGWSGSLSFFLALLMVPHTVALPQPDADKLRSNVPTSSVLHILAGGCGCSREVARQLIARTTHGDEEEILIIDGDENLSLSLTNAGYRTRTVSPEEATEAFGVQAAPWLLITGAEKILYSGGYAPQRPNRYSSIALEEILSRVHNGEKVAPYPSFGCAVSKNLKKNLDPLKLKYS